MEQFGQALQTLRVAAGWRQVDLVAVLGHRIARSTLANVESGREQPSPRLWNLICELLPDWEPSLAAPYEATRVRVEQTPARRGHSAETSQSRGDVALVSVRFVYLFGHSRSPEEILEVWRVRAISAGADGYDLRLTQTRHEGFRADEECLWGGSIGDRTFEDASGATRYARRVSFGRRLRRRESHEFAVRSWVAKDPVPDHSVCATLDVPCRQLSFQLNFWGSERPKQAWQYGPAPDGSVEDDGSSIGSPLRVSPQGEVAATFHNAEPGSEHGVGWRW